MRHVSKECQVINLVLSNVLIRNLKCRTALVAFMPSIPAWSSNKGGTRESIQTCWCLKIYCPKAVLAFSFGRLFYSLHFIENEEALSCCSRVKRCMSFTCELVGALWTFTNRESKLRCASSTLSAANPKTFLTQAGNSEFCGTGLFGFISFVTSLTYRGRESLKFFLLHNLKAVSGRYKTFSAHFIIFHPFPFSKKKTLFLN